MLNAVIVFVAVLLFFGFDHYSAFGLVVGVMAYDAYKEITAP